MLRRPDWMREKLWPQELLEVLHEIALLCPRAPGERELTEDDFEVRPADDSSGWYFTCTGCKKLRCVGFVPRKKKQGQNNRNNVDKQPQFL